MIAAAAELAGVPTSSARSPPCRRQLAAEFAAVHQVGQELEVAALAIR